MRLVSIDVGNVTTVAKSSTRERIFRSVTAFEQGGIRFDGFYDGNSLSNFVIEFEGEKIAVGDAAFKLGRLQVSDMGRHRIQGQAYRRLFAAALASCVGQSSDLSVIASLPVQFYTGARDEVRETLSGQYLIGLGNRTLEFNIYEEDLHLVPEGFGALCSLILGPQGQIFDDRLYHEVAGVVDAGGRTVDYLYFDHLEIIPSQSFGVDETGMSVLWQMLSEEIQRQFGRTLNNVELDEALHNGYFKRAGKQVDIRYEIEQASSALADAIISGINSKWDGGDAVDEMVFTGGGADFVYEWMPYNHKLLVEDPVMSNAVGGYRFGLMRGF